MFEFKLPDLGEGIAEGEILKWYVEVGQEIQENDPFVDVETDKAAVNITSPRTGKISALSAKVGDIVNVGDVIAAIDDGTGEAAAAPPAEKKEEAPAKKEVKAKVETKKEEEPAKKEVEKKTEVKNSTSKK
ncbi:biotin/lipoyl-binding protein [bacterium]|nr:biotin/lipoyl-binding protein [bacterium]